MHIRFWGVRGSLPSPLHQARIQEKIDAIVDQMLPEDLASKESKQRFLAGLPPWLYGTVGGNTSCVSVAIEDFDELIIFDCGSGLRELGLACTGESKPQKFHIVLSHFHWDHLMGFPFFDPAYNPSVTIDLYSPKPGLKEFLDGQMRTPYFPITMDIMAGQKNFHYLENSVQIGPAELSFREMCHPGGSFCYQLSHKGKRFIYATDTELATNDFLPSEENIRFFKNADVIVLDSQYTLGEAIDKYNWGHSAFSLSVDFAANWGIKRLVLFHHDPAYDDRKIHGMLQSARWYLERMDIKGLEVCLAVENMEIIL